MTRRVPGTGFWVGLAVAAGAAAAGFLHWESVKLDDGLREADGITLEGGVVRVTEKSRTWLTRELDVAYEVGGDALHWRGSASVGWGGKIALKLDTAKGLGRLIPAMGVQDWADEWLITSSVTGEPKDFTWTVKPFRLEGCAFDGMRLRTNMRTWSFEADGFRCQAPAAGGADGPVVAKMEMLRATGEHYKTLNLKTGAFLLGGVSGKRFALAYGLEPEKPKAKDEGAGVLDDVRRTETVTLEIMNPTSEDTTWDRFAMTSRLTGISDELLRRMRVVSAGAVLGGLTEAQLLAAFSALEDAFMRDGLVWELDEALLARDGNAARMAGRLAYVGPERPGAAPTLGRFTISVPDAMLGEKWKTEAAADGSMRLEGDFWVSSLELTTEHLIANDVVIIF